MIAIINYGMGNLASVQNALDYLDIQSEIISNPEDLHKYPKAILPGVGAFGSAMDNLKSNGFDDAIKTYALADKKPILGICLGMQLLLDDSCEYGQHEGLGLVKGKVLDFKTVIQYSPIQHVGWNGVIRNEKSLLYKDQEADSSYYFVHRYYCVLDELEDVATETDYEIKFHSSLEKDNIFGTQFHPEKSQSSGLSIFKSFGKL